MSKLTTRLTQFLAKKKHTHFINGAYVKNASVDKMAVINPADEEIIGHIAIGTSEEVKEAVSAAKKAFHHNSDWRKMSPDARGQIKKITFTGSTFTGKIIGKAAMENVTGVSLELGGKSPAIVFEDTIDIAATAKGVAAGIFRNQGQVEVWQLSLQNPPNFNIYRGGQKPV